MVYRHTQIGWVMGGAIGAVALLMVSSFASHSPKLLIVLGLLLLLFYALTVEIDGKQLRFWFGPGIIRKSIALQRIVSCKPVRNVWLCGWGIHWWGHGWLYNVSGLWAVELELDSGKRLRIGTDEPEELDRAIKQAIHQNSEFRTQDSE